MGLLESTLFKNISCCLFFNFFIFGLSAQEQQSFQLGNKNKASASLVWSGKIFSSEDNAPIIGAIIRSSNQKLKGYSDENGFFKITIIPGEYNVTISALSFETKEFLLSAFSDDNLDISLNPENVIIEGVVVKSTSENRFIEEVIPGLEQMDIKDLEAQSTFLGELDVMRSIQSLAGVSSVGEGSSGFNVRGGNEDQNLILLDGHYIFNASHALGFYSLFHPDLIKNVDLYKTGLPSKYGGRLSSTLRVNTRDGDLNKFKFKAGVGVVSGKLSAEGPIIKDRVSFIVGARSSYANWIFNLVEDPSLSQSMAFFW